MRILSIVISILILSSCSCVQQANRNESPTGKASAEFQVKQDIEDGIQAKLENHLARIVGPGHYQIAVSVKLDWREKSFQNVHYDSTNPAPLSEKTYTESSHPAGIAGPPGVRSNVQDSGIGTEETSAGSDVEERVTNYAYPWFDTRTKENACSIAELSVGVAIDYRTNESGKRVPYDPEELAAIEDVLRASINIPLSDSPDAPYKLVLRNILFAGK